MQGKIKNSEVCENEVSFFWRRKQTDHHHAAGVILQCGYNGKYRAVQTGLLFRLGFKVLTAESSSLIMG
jgi:hypothetical protein